MQLSHVRTIAVLLAALLLAPQVTLAQPLTSAFTYQGELSNGSSPASGLHDFRFRLYDALSAGTQIGATLCVDNVSVSNGHFNVPLDFGSQFAGQQRFLEIEVRADSGLSCANLAGFVILSPRQPLTATPNALFSLSASSATTATTATNATQLNGQSSAFYQSAANLSSGTLPDARLSTAIPRTNTANTFSGTNSFSSPPAFTIPTGTAPFSVTSATRVPNLNADLLDGLDSGAFSLSSHTHDAAAITAGTLVDARLSANIPRIASANTFSAGQTVSISAATPLALTSTNTGGSWMSLSNTSAGGHSWSLITTGPGNSEGAGKMLLRDNTANTVRTTIDTNGNIGIGTTTPGAPVDLQLGANHSLQFRLDNGLVPGINVNSTGGNMGIMRLRNSVEVWPSDDGTRAGRMDLRNTAGSPTIALDGASGNIAAANFPRAKFVQTYRDVRNYFASAGIDPGQSPNIDSLTVNIPASGVLMLRATIQLNSYSLDPDPAQTAYFKLSDTTLPQAVQLCETAWGIDYQGAGTIIASPYGTLSVEWNVNVDPGTRTYTTSLFNQSSRNIRYFTTSLQAVFIPGGL